ncbi:methyltransferase domain-containing protein [Sneathiella marina]|uniref:Methyltransferase domain-containing protein n=1 Tax=Sneathiella marina TaxID=2950108 RepID=A0ABY4W054_9PROT|nr:methyltransferase domain-containing protein [Sneathiella marina]USG60582.1 methyltransferase domain-containing protein [Sneathiella marina]
MTQSPQKDAVIEFYDLHPINEQQILEKLGNDGFDTASVSQDILQNYDQDHYGGVAANDALAALASLDADCHLLDVCCGLGGPSRYFAQNYGCRVTGVDLTESRIEGATRLTAIAGLDKLAQFKCANALDLPFADTTFDVLVSQEAFCHVPEKDRLVGECVRVLKPGGRMAFTDILVTEKTTDATRVRLEKELVFQELNSAESYRRALEREGCTLLEAVNLSDQWRIILVERLDMFRSLKGQTIDRFGEAHFVKWDNAYSFFVGLFETGELAGGRFLARR